jgi:glycosyltransferase involved in cell wall biosynthesis
MGAEGISVHHGSEMLLASAPGTFAEAVIKLLADRAKRLALGRSARELALSRYAWSILLPTLDEVYPVAS